MGFRFGVHAEKIFRGLLVNSSKLGGISRPDSEREITSVYRVFGSFAQAGGLDKILGS
jgi:hypothetical protein